ncbi:hypothetical protein DFP73DRAFT_589201 [Morchella snyderi]|nr:hypothetical protein DFP73DRAFT_589201 [Morchella snyderi]
MKKYTSLRRSSRSTQWHPMPLRPFFLLSFLVLVSIIIIAIQLLIPQPILVAPSFLFDYIPTTIPIALSLVWAFSAHDYKRLEPFFQLSSPTGALAEDSLLLEYSYMFTFFIPVVSLRKGHYAIFLSSIIMLLLTFLITPFSSALFDPASAYVDAARGNFPYLDFSPEPVFTAGFAHSAYAYSFLNGSLPPFTTPDYALTPWVDATPANSTWRGQSRIYESNLGCVQPTLEPFEDAEFGPIGYNVTNIDGKAALFMYRSADGFNDSDEILNLQNRYGNISEGIVFSVNNSVSIAWAMKEISGSGEETALGYLYIMGAVDPKNDGSVNLNGDDWTALWCEPTYWQQDVEATVQMPSGEVVVGSVERTGEAMVLDNTITRQFGKVMLRGSLGDPPDYSNMTLREMSDIPVRFGADTRDLPAVQSLIRGLGWIYSYLDKRGPVPRPSETLRALSAHVFIGISDGETDERVWRDPKVMAQHYEQKWKTMFAFAMAQQMTDPDTGSSRSVIISKLITGWRVSPGWGRVTQASFGLLAALVLGLVVMGTWQGGRRIELDGEPNSLSNAMAMLEGSGKRISDLFDGLEYSGPKKVGSFLKQRGHKYKLTLVEEVGPRLEVLPRGGDDGKLAPPAEGNSGSKAQGLVSPSIDSIEPGGAQSLLLLSLDPPCPRETFKPEENWILLRKVGLLLILFLCSVTGVMVFLYIYDINNQGLPTVYPPNSFGFKFIYSYVPTLLATGIEPIIIALGTYHCMVAPYKRLRSPKNRADSALALSLDFDRSPPQFQLLRAIRFRDAQVGALALAILVVNLLAITFGSLFFVSMEARTSEVPATVWDMPESLASFSNLAGDVYLGLSATLSNRTRNRYNQEDPLFYLPPMSFGADQVYDPRKPHVLDQLTHSQSPAGEIEWSSFVFGSDVKCVLIPQEGIQSSCTDGMFETVSCGEPLPSDSNGTFTADVNVAFSGGEVSWGKGTPDKWSFDGMSTDAFIHIQTITGSSFLIGWSEMPADPEPKSDVFPSTQLPRIDTVALYCDSHFKVGSVTASLDTATGVIKTSNVVFPLEFGNNGSAIEIIMNFNVDISHGEGSNYWELIDGDRSLMWFNWFMARLYPDLVRDELVNATHIPSTDRLVEAFENVYDRLFAQSLQMYSDNVFANVTTKDITAVFRTKEPRVRVSKGMFIISCAVMVYLILVLLALYCRPRANDYYQNYLPTSLALMWTLLYASTAKDDCAQLRGSNPEERASQLVELGNTYSLGEFVGNDGRTHWGVSRTEKPKDLFTDSKGS